MTGRRAIRSGGALAAVLALAIAGCVGSAAPSSVTLPPTSSPVTVPPGTEVTTGPPASSPTTVVADDSLRLQLDWFVAALNGAEVSASEYEARFVEEFRTAVPYQEGFLPVLEQMTDAQGKWLVVSLDRPDPTSGMGLIAAGEERVQISISIEPDPPHRIVSLLVQPATLADPPATLEESTDRLAEHGTLRLLAAEVRDGVCVPIHQVAGTEPAPLGSVFKLYVLAVLAQTIAEGEISWDDPVVISDRLKSIPSGVLQDESAGTEKTVEEVARLMITISDNTATDHLIDLLGRERIETTLAELGNSTPELNIPFLTTRELAALKIGPASGLRVQYLAADVAGKRAILKQISDITPADIPVAGLTEPVDPDRLEWFASPADLCTLLVDLWTLGRTPGLEPVAEILSENPGVAPAAGRWDYLAFKGGSEPGLVAMAWLMQGDDGRIFTLTGSVVNPVEVIPEIEAVLTFAAARDLLK